jgi:hypothetical protein
MLQFSQSLYPQGVRYTTARLDRRKGDEGFMHPVILVIGALFGLAGYRVA